MERPYFVMLTCQYGGVTQMLDAEADGGDDMVAMFETVDEASAAASNNPLGKHFGFEVFELGGGVAG